MIVPAARHDEFQKRLNRLNEIFKDLVVGVEDSWKTRCPYRDRHDLCTAQFSCRNQEWDSTNDGVIPTCGHEGSFDYRSAWEKSPLQREVVEKRIIEIRKKAESRRNSKVDDEVVE
ncbi:MAG: hypothetical protein CMO26_24220 [Thiotrichales bacterium]|nr:hypothetical protein [Thiotrichales bacterium]